MCIDKSLAFSVMVNDPPEDYREKVNFNKVVAAISNHHCTMLDLSDLHVTGLPKNLAKLCPRLKVLKIAGNRIEELPSGLENLEEIDWSRNDLFSVPICLKNYKKLKNLDLSKNRIELVSEGLISSLQGLKELNLNDHRIYMGKERNYRVMQEVKTHPTLKLFHFKHFNAFEPCTIDVKRAQAALNVERVQRLAS